MKHFKPYLLPLSLAAVQWLVTTLLHTDRAFFTYDHVTPWMVATKVLYLLFLAVTWSFLFASVRNIRAGKPAWRRGGLIAGCYFAVMLVFLLLMWPGTWSWDDLFTLEKISTYQSFDPWQHIITGAYQSVLLQILPFPGGVILLQNAIISVCVAFLVTKLEASFPLRTLPNKALDIFVKVLPFLLPPVLIYQFSGYRLGLYIYLELVLLVMLLCAWKDKEEWSVSYLLLFVFLAVIVSLWRTESFLYLILVLVMIPCIKRDVLPKAKKAVCLALVVIGFLGIYKVQSVSLGQDNYQLMSVMRPVCEVVRHADPTTDAEELSVIDQVLNVDEIIANPNIDGEQMFWRENTVRDSYTQEDYSNLLKSFVSLSKKYPGVVLRERTALFVRGSGLTGNPVTCSPYAAAAYDPDTTIEAAVETQSKHWIGNRPISRSVRKNTINALSCRKPNGTFMQKPYRVVWNAIIPEVILLAAWVVCIVKKKWWPFGILTAVLLKLPIIFLTEPSGWFMYVLSFYLLGYTLLVYRLLGRRGRNADRPHRSEPDAKTASPSRASTNTANGSPDDALRGLESSNAKNPETSPKETLTHE